MWACRHDGKGWTINHCGGGVGHNREKKGSGADRKKNKSKCLVAEEKKSKWEFRARHPPQWLMVHPQSMKMCNPHDKPWDCTCLISNKMSEYTFKKLSSSRRPWNCIRNIGSKGSSGALFRHPTTISTLSKQAHFPLRQYHLPFSLWNYKAKYKDRDCCFYYYCRMKMEGAIGDYLSDIVI